MQRRHLLKSAALAFALLVSSVLVQAQKVDPGYQLVNPPQAGGVNGQIEVIEFFSYGCSHCNEFDPMLTKWRAEQPKDVVFRRVPVSFGSSAWETVGRIYLTLNAMGISDKYDPEVFKALHKDRVALNDEKVRNDWLAKQGIDVKVFSNTWRSFSVDTMAKRAEQLGEAYKIQAVPTLIINGKYMIQGGDKSALENASRLVAKERAAHPVAAPAEHAASSSAPAAKHKKPAKK